MANYPIKMLKDEENEPFVPLVGMNAVVDPDGGSLGDKLAAKLEATNIIAGTNILLNKSGNNITITSTASGSGTLIDNLTTATAGLGALDARQGKILNDKIPGVANNLTTISADDALSAYQGYILNNKFSSYTPTGELEELLAALKAEILLAAHPVGSYYWSNTNTNPANLFGGTWIQIKDKFVIAVGDDHVVGRSYGSNTKDISHTHSYSHTHGVPGVVHKHSTGNHTLTTSEMPRHVHDGITWGLNGTPFIYTGVSGSDGTFDLAGAGVYRQNINYGGTNHLYTSYAGGDGAHSHGDTGNTTPSATTTNSQSTSTSGSGGSTALDITPASIAAYCWQRTA